MEEDDFFKLEYVKPLHCMRSIRSKLVSDSVEAIVAAFYVTGGLRSVIAVVKVLSLFSSSSSLLSYHYYRYYHYNYYCYHYHLTTSFLLLLLILQLSSLLLLLLILLSKGTRILANHCNR